MQEKHSFALLFVYFVLLVPMVWGDCGIYVSSKGDYYNTTGLTKKSGAYSVLDSNGYGYVFNFCQNIGSFSTKCDTNTPAIQTGCAILGYLPGVLQDHPTNASNGFQLVYTNTQNSFCSTRNIQRVMTIIVNCNRLALTPYIDNLEEPSMCSYVVYMESISACPVFPSHKSNNIQTQVASRKIQFSGGTIFIFILFGSTVLYLAFGAAINFIRGKRGKQTIPNFRFWKRFFGYVRDGVNVVRFTKVKIDYFKAHEDNVSEDVGLKSEEAEGS